MQTEESSAANDFIEKTGRERNRRHLNSVARAHVVNTDESSCAHTEHHPQAEEKNKGKNGHKGRARH